MHLYFSDILDIFNLCSSVGRVKSDVDLRLLSLEYNLEIFEEINLRIINIPSPS